MEIKTDNQIAKHFIERPSLSNEEAQEIVMLKGFGMFSISLKPQNIHMLAERLPEIPNEEVIFNDTVL